MICFYPKLPAAGMKRYRYPFLDLQKINSTYASELKEAANRVIDSGRYIGGEEIELLSERLKGITGRKHCIPVSNGLDGLRLALRAFIVAGRIKKGSEVIVPVNSFIASALAIVDAGLRPIFVEPDEMTLLLDSRKAEDLLSERTGALMSVDLYGRVWADSDLINRVSELGIVLIEDAAQALGATTDDGIPAGSVGECGIFSFYPTKNVGALGDGGAVVTSDDEVADIIGSMANYGKKPYDLNYRLRGYNCRMDPLQAAMLCVKLDGMNFENKTRRRNAALYRETIRSEYIILPPDDPGMIYHQFEIRVPFYRDQFIEYLESNRVETAIHYPTPLDREPCMHEFVIGQSKLAMRLADELVSLPISSSTSTYDIKEIAEIINTFSPTV